MFNEDLKNRFIEECLDSEDVAYRTRRMFKISEKYEKAWGADLCTRNAEELGEAVEEMIGVRTGAQASHLSMLRKYAKWCLNNEVPGACNGLLNIHEVGLKKIRTRTVSGPKHLQEYFDLAFPPEYDCRIDNVYRCFFWMAFAGLNEEDTSQVLSSDIDIKNMVIRFGGKTYPIYSEAIPAFRHLCTADAFLCDFVRYEKVMSRVPGRQVLRGVKGDDGVNTDTIRRSALKKFSAAFETSKEGIKVSYKNIQLSGVFYRIYEEEKSTGQFDFSKFFEEYFKNKTDRTNRRQTQVREEFYNDYLRWKTAFDK